ncbi:MAG: glycosyl transferase [Rhodospirillales bacterium]|nr:glycosyl transferase [Rhodospirillales bacterium]
MSGRKRVLFYVQHLLGIGHLKRAATITRAAQAAGLDVTLVSGGNPVPGLALGGARLIQLPPLRAADKYFKILLDEHDQEWDDAFKDRRRDLLLGAYGEIRPHVIVTELYPFGRRQLRGEILALLDAARTSTPRPIIACSVRDILVEPPKPERITEMLDRIESLYDAVMVHGDPELIPFDATFPPAEKISGKLHYTGYVVDRSGVAGPDQPGAGEVLVSAGGGAVSETLFRAAIEARPLTSLSDVTWRILAGPALPETEFQSIAATAPEGVIVERARPDFTSLLANCALSISQGGYNTVMEVMAARIRGVIVPYAGGLETEQTLRANLLREYAALQVLDENAVTATAIAEAVEAALAGPTAVATKLDTGGAEASARLLAELAEGCAAP